MKNQTFDTTNKNTFINALLYVFMYTFYLQTQNPAPKFGAGFLYCENDTFFSYS